MTSPVVGYVVRMFPQTSETFIANELVALEKLGVRTRVYSYRNPREPVAHTYFRHIQAQVTYLPDPINRHLGQMLSATRAVRRQDPERYGRTFRYVLRHTVRERNPDTWRRFLQAGYLSMLLHDSDVEHLHAHMAHGATRVAMLAGMLTGLPYSFTAHARDVFKKNVNTRLLREKVEKARFVVTVSEYSREFLAEKIGSSVNGHMRVLYNGVDLERFSPDPSVKRESDYILSVGRFVEKKGISRLIRALALLRDQGRRFRCELVGDGPLRSAIEREVRRLGLEALVTFAGSRPQEELPDRYRRATLLAMPAVLARDGDRDALPTVLLEATACGLPAVASRLSGIPEIIEHETTGLLVEPDDPAELARAIERLLADPPLRDRLGAAARAKAVRLFDSDANARELGRWFGGRAREEYSPAQ